MRSPRGTRRIRCGRVDLLTQLLAARADADVALRCSVADTGAFLRVLEAVRTGPDPTPVAGGAGRVGAARAPTRHPVIADVEHWCARVADEGATFTDLGAPFARGA